MKGPLRQEQVMDLLCHDFLHVENNILILLSIFPVLEPFPPLLLSVFTYQM